MARNEIDLRIQERIAAEEAAKLKSEDAEFDKLITKVEQSIGTGEYYKAVGELHALNVRTELKRRAHQPMPCTKFSGICEINTRELTFNSRI